MLFHSVTVNTASTPKYTFTFKKVGFLFSTVTWSWDGKCSINVIWYVFKSNCNVPRVVLIQDVTVKPPVLFALKENKYKASYCNCWLWPTSCCIFCNPAWLCVCSSVLLEACCWQTKAHQPGTADTCVHPLLVHMCYFELHNHTLCIYAALNSVFLFMNMLYEDPVFLQK